MFSCFTDETNKPVTVTDRFSAAVVLNPNKEIVKTPQGKIVRVPAESRLVSGSDDGTLLGPDRKKVGYVSQPNYLQRRL